MRSFLISAASAFGLLLLACALSSAPAAAQQSCTVTYDCQGSSGCSSVMGGNVTQRTLSYASQSACDTAAADAQHGLPTIKCSCGGSGTSDTAGNIGQLISTMTPQQQMGVAVGAVGTLMVLKGLSELMNGTPAPAPDPAAQQRALAAQQLNNSGIYLMKQKNYSGAVNEFQQALAQAPNDANIAHNLAMAKRAQQNSALAQQRSGELGQLLGTTPAAAGNPEIASNSSPLNLVNLNNPSTNELHPPGEAPPVNQAALQNQIDGALGNQPPAPAPTQTPTQAQEIDQIFNPSQATPPQPPQSQIDAEQKQVDNLFATPGAKDAGSTPAAAQLAQQASLGQAAANAPSPEDASAMARQGFDTAAPSTVVPAPSAAAPGAAIPQAAVAAVASPSNTAEPGPAQQPVAAANQPVVVADLKTPPAPVPEYPITPMHEVTSGAAAPGSPIFDCAGDRAIIQRLPSGLPAQDEAIRRTEEAIKAAKEDSEKARTDAMFAAVSTMIASASTATNWAQIGMARASASSMALDERKEALDAMQQVVDYSKKLNDVAEHEASDLKPGESMLSHALEMESTAKTLAEKIQVAQKFMKDSGLTDALLEKGAVAGTGMVAGPVGAAVMETLIHGADLCASLAQKWNSDAEAEQAERYLEAMRYSELQVRSRIYELQQEVVTECSNTKTAGR